MKMFSSAAFLICAKLSSALPVPVLVTSTTRSTCSPRSTSPSPLQALHWSTTCQLNAKAVQGLGALVLDAEREVQLLSRPRRDVRGRRERRGELARRGELDVARGP